MNEAFLGILVKRHQGEIYRYVRYLGAQDADAQDLVQETFVAAFENPNGPSPEDEAQWPGWLRGIARNRFLRLCRSNRREYPDSDPTRLEAAELIWQEDAEPVQTGEVRLQALQKCLEELPERERKAIEMRYRERKSRADMGTSLALSEDGVKSFLRRLRTALGNCITRRLAGDA